MPCWMDEVKNRTGEVPLDPPPSRERGAGLGCAALLDFVRKYLVIGFYSDAFTISFITTFIDEKQLTSTPNGLKTLMRLSQVKIKAGLKFKWPFY